MKTIKAISYILSSASLLLLFSLSSCGQPTEPILTTEPVLAEEAEPTEASPAEPAVSEQIVTQITIDGDPSDWEGYDVLIIDPEGDHQGGGFDIAEVRAFTNDQFLYILIETHEPATDYVQIDLDIFVGEKHYVVSINPRDESTGWMGDVTGSEWIDIGEIVDWHSKAGEAIEYKMPLSYLDNATEISLVVFPMAGECCDYPAWYRIDEINPVNVPTTDEVEYGETSVSAESEPTITQITIDGDPSDWAERPLLKEDPVGDSDPDVLDLTDIYAFRNQNAIYLMLKMENPGDAYEEIGFIFLVGDHLVHVSLNPKYPRGQRGYIAVESLDYSEYYELGDTAYSAVVLGSVLEARIDLRDIGQSEDIQIQTIDVMAGECCQPPAWHAADNFGEALAIPVVNELDPAELLARIPSSALGDWLDLPPGWKIEPVFAPPLPDVFQLTKSKSGVIFVEQHTFTSAISTIDPDTGAVKRVLDLPFEPSATVGIAGGPGDTVFRVVRNEIWQINLDGSHEIWGNVIFGQGTRPTFYTESGQLIGFKYNDPTCVIELLPDAMTRDLACGFNIIWDVIADKDGTLYVADWGGVGQVIKVAPDGTRQLIADNLVFIDPIDIGFNASGDLFISEADKPFRRWDATAQKVVPLSWSLTECAFHAADFEFAGDSKVIFMDITAGGITWADLDTNTSGVLVPSEGVNSIASAIGPDGALYWTTDGCRGDPPTKIRRMQTSQTPEIVVSDLPDRIWDLALTPEGEIYIVANLSDTNSNSLYYFAPGSKQAQVIPDSEGLDIRDIAVLPNGNAVGWVHRTNHLVEFSPDGFVQDISFDPPELIESFSMDYGPDGYLYGFAELARNDRKGPMVYRQLLQVDLMTGKTEIVYENDTERALASGTMDVAPDGSFWLLVFPDLEMYHVLPDGTATRIAKELPADSWRVNVDNDGNVYFSSPSGIYRLYNSQQE